jgi:hypothetical protein
VLTRRQLVIGLVASLAMTGPALARDFSSEVEAKLSSQGYEIESVARTLLGRVRILARNAEGEREIILNPRTGEILRDLWLTRGKSGQSMLLDDNGKSGKGNDNSGSGSGDDDDDDDEDNSGSGGGSGGNSGEGGSGGSGGGDDDD